MITVGEKAYCAESDTYTVIKYLCGSDLQGQICNQKSPGNVLQNVYSSLDQNFKNVFFEYYYFLCLILLSNAIGKFVLEASLNNIAVKFASPLRYATHANGH